MTTEMQAGSSGFTGAAGRLITGWALLGGLLLLIVVTVNMVSIIGSNFSVSPFLEISS
ncbi:hypothetical protein [Labrenzia sp. DG1229]|uniref:hypothetical protein n=1 Tax=Labrenzia sp. DG1229 TaxID=681847 RepID=UPI000ABD9548|nr:hypothetical protein [Labrenzia sp. DG1229]